MSSIKWPVQASNLTVYEGGVPGKASVRKAEMEVGGFADIRKTEWVDAKGNGYRLNTRGGFPEVICTEARKSSPDVEVARGFLAHIVSSLKAAAFSPYSLMVLNPSYLVFGHTYTVLPFSTTYNVPTTDLTKWNDTLTFFDGKVLVNGKSMPIFSGAPIPEKSLPWVIPDTTTVGASKYGVSADRLFAVTRYCVKSYAGDGSVVYLGGEKVRAERNAMLNGAMVAPSNVVNISQFGYIGPAWDDIASGWAFNAAEVSMLLTPPYLIKVDKNITVDQPVCQLVNTGDTSGVDITTTTFPDTPMYLVGTGVLYATGDLDVVKVRYPWTGKVSAPIVGFLSNAYSRSNYHGEFSSAYDVAGVNVNVSFTNDFTAENATETVANNEQWWDLPTSQFYTQVLCGSDGTTSPSSLDHGPHGGGEYGSPSVNYGFATWASSKSIGNFSVKTDQHNLVVVDLSREKVSGGKRKLTTNDWTKWVFEQPVGSDWAVSSGYDLTGKGIAFNATGGTEDSPERAAARENMVATANGFVGTAAYSTLDDWFRYASQVRYIASTVERDPVDRSLLTWETTDFILHDEENQVFIYVSGYFSATQNIGSNATATFSSVLHIDSPSGKATLQLFSTDMQYLELLPEETIRPGIDYVPSPQIRVMFNPLYRGQGDFKGAAYTTKVERENGAVQSTLLNFMLSLETYDFITDIGEAGSAEVKFIPCNMLEMLYAYVYSSKYGVDDYERYPVTFHGRFKHFQDTLFSSKWRVNYRDGAFIDWLDTLGGAYVTEQTTELYRI